MKYLKFKFFIVVIFLFVAVAGFYGNSLDVFAAGTVDNLHSQTKIYNSNNTDYFDGCENYADYVKKQGRTINLLFFCDNRLISRLSDCIAVLFLT